MNEPADTPASMPDDHGAAVEELLAEVLAKPPAERPGQLQLACARHPSLAGDLGRQLGTLLRLGLLPAADARVGTEGADATPPMPPSQLGPFRLGGRLGGGGMGVVHQAVDPTTGRRVAVKLVRPELLPFAETRARSQREVAVLANLDHPGLMPVLQYGENQGVPWYAMPLVNGRTLAAVLSDLAGQDPHRLTPEALGRPRARTYCHAAGELVQDVALALQHAHANGVVHRDVKPSNIMLTDDGRALLIDFGLAHAANQDSLTRTGVQPGSLAYMAPEQLRGELIDARSDVFSLGCVLYELLTLRSPFAADTEQQIRHNVLAAAPIPPRTLHPGLPWEASVLVATAMAPEPGLRYASAGAFADDLLAWLEARPIAARRAGPLRQLRRFSRRQPALTIAIMMGALLLGGLPTGLYVGESQAREREQLLRLAADQESVRARAAEASAHAELENQRQIAEFAASVFRRANPEELGGRPDVALRDAFDAVVAEVGTQARPYTPAVQATIEMMIAGHYRAMGRPRASEPHLARAFALRRQHLPPDSPELADAGYELGRLARQLGELGAAERFQRDALQIRQRVLAANDPYIAQSWSGLGITLRLQERFAEAEAATRAAIDCYSRRFGPDDHNVGICLGNLASLQQERGRLADAAASLERSLALLRRQHGDRDHADVVRREFQLGLLECRRGAVEVGLPRMQQAFATMQRLVAGRQPILTEMATQLGRELTGLGRYADAEIVLGLAATLAEQEQLGGAEAECAMAQLLVRTGRAQSAVELLQQQLRRPTSRLGEARLLLALAESRAATGTLPAAFATLDRTWACLEEIPWATDRLRRRTADVATQLCPSHPDAIDAISTSRWRDRQVALPESH